MESCLTPSESNVLVDVIQASLRAMYATIAPSGRQEAIAAEANAILQLFEPEYEFALFERLEFVVLLSADVERLLVAKD